MIMSAQEDIRILLFREHMTITALAEKMSAVLDKKVSRSSLSQKLINGTLRYNELEAICQVLGYTIEYKKNTP
ncbi:TPA: hypothetical protein IAD52_03125 [Candidatus Spyradomonas excrementavium]|nr:hypothetical protein [Candidatus Spyradomonas excrementavium]